MLCNANERSAGDREFASTWAPESEAEPRWRIVDRELRKIAGRRAALDAEEARWLREAEALQIWRMLGMVSAIDYLERVLGYAPRTAQDKLRVARALGALPQLSAALAGGRLLSSAVRELTRVATPATERDWIDAASGKSLRQIEELVADHRPGDGPGDPPDPEARMHVVRFELAAETFALMRQTRTVLDDEHGTNLADDAFVAAMCSAVLDGAPASEPNGRAKFQIAVTVCRRCGQGWQEGAGAQIAIDAAAVDRAMCDAQHIGSIDGSAPQRAYQDIPPSVVRFVWRRDGGRCRVDGCRSSRGLELHHIVHRADGGTHDPQNIVILCGSCHMAHHRGALSIFGTADHLTIHRPAEVALRTSSDDRRTGTSSAIDAGAHVGAPAEVGSNADAGVRDERTCETPRASTESSADAGVGAEAQVGPLTGEASVASDEPPIAHASVRVGATKLDTAIVRTQAKAALVGLGWKPAIAHAAVAAAASTQGPEVTLERLIYESLRRCRVSRA